MAIVRWDPFREVYVLQKGINRLFDDVAARMFGVSGTRYPKLDLTETKDELRLTAELPGVAKDDVKVSITHNALSISGDRKVPALPEGACSLREERDFGPLERSVELPVAVDTDRVKAAFKHGILTITLHKREEAKPKQIQVEVS